MSNDHKFSSLNDLVARAAIQAMFAASKEIAEHKQHEIQMVSASTEQLVRDIEQVHFMRLVDKALDNRDESMFLLLVGGLDG